jgi:hypothetical protein
MQVPEWLRSLGTPLLQGLAAVGGGVGVFLIILGGAKTQPYRSSTAPVAPFRLLNSKGRSLLQIEGRTDGSHLRLFEATPLRVVDVKGKTLMQIDAYNSSPRLRLLDGSGDPIVWTGREGGKFVLKESSASLSLVDQSSSGKVGQKSGKKQAIRRSGKRARKGAARHAKRRVRKRTGRGVRKR